MMTYHRLGICRYAMLILAVQLGAEVQMSLAETNLKDRWANRSLALARELASDDELEKHQREYVRNMTAHLLAAAGHASEAKSLVVKDGEFSEVMTLQMIAAGQAMRDDVQGALETIEPLSGMAKQRAIHSIAVEQARRGNLEDAKRLLSQMDPGLKPQDRDFAIESIARFHVDQGEIDAALELAKGIKGQDRRAKLEERAKEIGKLLSPEDPGYVEQQIKLASGNNLSEEKVRLVRALASAKAAGAKNDIDFARKQIESATKLVQDQSLVDRSFELMRIGQAAEEAGANEEAANAFRQGLEDYIEQERPLNNFTAAYFISFEPNRWRSVGRALSANELEQLVRSALAKRDMDDLAAALMHSLVIQKEFQRIDKLYDTLKTPHQRWKAAVQILNAL